MKKITALTLAAMLALTVCGCQQVPFDGDYTSSIFVSQDSVTNLGVHEHWNNAEERLYSRNLGKEEGIELISIEP